MSRTLAAVVVLLLLAGPTQAARSSQDKGVQPAPPATGQSASSATAEADQADDLPVSLARIRKGLAIQPKLKLEPPERDDLPRFYVEINATPSLQPFLQGFDFKYGPVPGAAPTHGDIMALVTPKELYSQAGFDAMSVLTANLGFATMMYLAQKAFTALAHAKNEREVLAIREQIKKELAELERARSEKRSPGASPPS